MSRIEIRICLGSSCFARGNQQLVHLIKEYIHKEQLDGKVIFKGARCFNSCKSGPVMQVNGQLIEGINEDNLIGLLNNQLKKYGLSRQ